MGWFSSALALVLAVSAVPFWLQTSPSAVAPATEVATCICKYEVGGPSHSGWSASALVCAASLGASLGSLVVLSGFFCCRLPGGGREVVLRERRPRNPVGAIRLGDL